MPLHVIQRGVNRFACFFNDVDRRYYLTLLAKFAARRGCAVHAYVLMSNHVHLLLTPGAKGAASALMQDLGRSYVRVMNTIHGRTGTLWEGRFKSSLVDSETYLLACQRYIELNPVRARMIERPYDYAWSSHRHYAHGAPTAFLIPHEAYASLGSTPSRRQAAYRTLFDSGLEPETIEKIRTAANTGTALGPQSFVERVESMLGRRAGAPRRGRPPKTPEISGVSGNLL